jgi:multiple sugar transport system substrate-binding protein
MDVRMPSMPEAKAPRGYPGLTSQTWLKPADVEGNRSEERGNLPEPTLLDRRTLLKGAVAGAGAAATSRFLQNEAEAGSLLGVLSPMPPDPAPPGVASFSQQALATWQKGYQTYVNYEAAAWSQLHDKLVTNFALGEYIHDVTYMCGWIPEFSEFLTPIGEMLPESIKADLPSSSFNSVTWNGDLFGVPFTLSLLTLFYNVEHLQIAELSAPPASWEELKGYAAALTRDGRYGWVCNYGMPSGIGGTASYWMAFLQQAGGTMYDQNGLPIFNSDPGVDALQLMIDLMPYSDPGSLTNLGIVDATVPFKSGTVAMMMNWPFMWADVRDIVSSPVAGMVSSSILPAGAAGSASIDGADSWSITANSWNPELAMKLVNFYLDADVQKQQAIATGWLPIRLSVLGDPEVQAEATNAPVLLEQAQHPYDSFITPDYEDVTFAIGLEIQKALGGEKTAAQAIADASATVTDIVRQRL